MARSTAGSVIGGLLGATVLALAGCGADRGGSVALGDGAPAPALTTPSHSGVVFVPLDSPTPVTTASPGGPGSGAGSPGTTPPASTGSGSTGSGSKGSGSGGTHPGGQPGTPGSSTGGGSGGSAGSGGSGGGATGGGSGGTPTGTGSPTPGGGGGTGGSGGGTPQTPASLTITALRTADTAQRWCQRVTLTLANSGDRAATSGTVTFATHVIGALGIDWWTYRTSQPLDAPVAGHASTDESWTVCLDSWRVPLGMHLETRTAALG